MLKPIASDIDGTLIAYGQETMPPELFDLIRRLRRAGVLFCPASGRQYHSLRALFAPVAEDLCYLCENGAVVFGPGPEEAPPLLSKTPMPREEALDLARAILRLPDCEAYISGQQVGYVCSRSPVFLQEIEEFLENRSRYVERPEDIPEDILKVSAFCPHGTERIIEALGPRWGACNMAVSGPRWLDFNAADKGVGLRGLCRALDIDLADTVVFGDNWNDVPMLEIAGKPWLMETAAPALRERFPRQCRSVTAVLEELLETIAPSVSE